MSTISTVASQTRNDPKVIRGWAFFDWANSAYSLVITSAIFPGYFLHVTADEVDLFGMRVADSTLYAWCIAFAYLVIAALAPILSGIADYGGRKKAYMRFFTILGSLSCMALVFFKDMPTLWIGVSAFVLATIGFAGGIVFYNAYLPIIATEDRYDDVSAKGYSYGYIGSALLLVVNLVVILQYQWFGFATGQMAVPSAFVMVGVWWLAFAAIPLRRLPPDSSVGTVDNLIFKGYEELKKAGRILSIHRPAKRYLIAFFSFNAGINALLFLAATFAEKVLDFKATQLITLVLVLQVVGVLGAWLLAKASDRYGNRPALLGVCALWLFICVAGFQIQNGPQFFIMAGFVGMAMGGAQSLARSTYAKFLPEKTTETTSFFSFYDVMDKLSTVVGTFFFGFVEQLGFGMRGSVLAMTIFFLLGIFFLRGVKVQRMQEATS